MLQIFAAITSLAGLGFIIAKSKYGFLAKLPGYVLWGALALAEGLFWMAGVNVIYFIFTIFGYNVWKRDEKRVETLLKELGYKTWEEYKVVSSKKAKGKNENRRSIVAKKATTR